MKGDGKAVMDRDFKKKKRYEPKSPMGTRKINCPACRIPPRPAKCPDGCWCSCHKKGQ